MERHSRRYIRVIENDRGQSSVEYAIVLGAILCIVVALVAFANVLDDGLIIQHALSAASHNVSGSAGGVIDVFAF